MNSERTPKGKRVNTENRESIHSIPGGNKMNSERTPKGKRANTINFEKSLHKLSGREAQ